MNAFWRNLHKIFLKYPKLFDVLNMFFESNQMCAFYTCTVQTDRETEMHQVDFFCWFWRRPGLWPKNRCCLVGLSEKCLTLVKTYFFKLKLHIQIMFSVKNDSHKCDPKTTIFWIPWNIQFLVNFYNLFPDQYNILKTLKLKYFSHSPSPTFTHGYIGESQEGFVFIFWTFLWKHIFVLSLSHS